MNDFLASWTHSKRRFPLRLNNTVGQIMKPSKDELTFPHFQTFANAVCDENGFRAEESKDWVFWRDVEQVALVFEMTPTIAIIEPDTYIGFRLKNPDLSVWVCSTFEDPFAAEVGRRFAPVAAPRVADWKEKDRCIASYSIWPDARKGEPLYVNFRKNWWSSDATLAFRKEPNQRITDNSGASPLRV